jgi:hypothetical protein
VLGISHKRYPETLKTQRGETGQEVANRWPAGPIGGRRLVEVEKSGEGTSRNADSTTGLRFPLKLSRTEVVWERRSIEKWKFETAY